MARVEGLDKEGKSKKPAPKPAKKKNPLDTGGFLNPEMNQYESSRFSEQARPAVPTVGTTGLSINLDRLAREIAADQKKSKENKKNNNQVKKHAVNSFKWLIDQLSRTGNAVSTGLLYEGRVGDKDGDNFSINSPLDNISAFAKGAREGFNLNERTNLQEVFKEGGYTGRGAGTIGFIGDLALDPLNIPLGAIAAPIRGGNAAIKALGKTDTARASGNSLQEGVKSRAGTMRPTDLRVDGVGTGGSYTLSRSALEQGDSAESVLAEGAAVIARGKKSKAETNVEAIIAQMESPAAKAAVVQAAAETGKIDTPVLTRLLESLPGKTDVRIEPLRAADEAARLRPIVETVRASAKAGAKNSSDAVPLDQMPQDVIDTIEYAARKNADAWFDKMGKSGGQKMADLRRQVATEGRNPNLIKLGGKKGADIDVSASGNLRAVEQSDEYIAALKRGREAAIKAHNKALPKAKKEGPILGRTLAAIPAAEEIVSTVAKQADEPVGVSNVAMVSEAVTPVVPAPVADKLAAAAQSTYQLSPELEKAVDDKIEKIVNNITNGTYGAGQKGHTYFSPIKQANLYNSIRDALVNKMGYKKGKDRAALLVDPEFRQFVREQFIRAEEIMEIRHGFRGMEWKPGMQGTTGARSQRLSDFFAHVPVEDEIAGLKNDGRFWTKVMNESELANRIHAGTAVAEAPRAAAAIETAVDTAIEAVDNLPESVAMDVLDAAPKAAKDSVEELSPSAKETVKDNVTAAVDGIAEAKGEVWKVRFDNRAARIADESGSARLGLREAEAVDRVIGIGNIGNHSLLKINATKLGARLSPAGVKALSDAAHKARATGERMTVRFHAGHGFDPFFHTMRRSVANSAAARSQQHMGEISKTFTGMSHDDVRNVLTDMQMGKVDTPQAEAAQKMLTTLFDPEDGWLVQNGITMTEFNEQLHRLYPTRKNAQGKAETSWRPEIKESPVDKLKNAKPDATWHDSWKYWNWTDNPAVDLLKVRLAFENSLAQRHMYEDLAHNFGIAKASKEAAAQAKKEGWGEVKRLHPALDGYLYPPEIAEQINKHEDMFRMRKDSTSEFMQKYDKMLQMWKTGVTIYSPSHHIRNMVGDMWSAYFVDGVKSPVHYQQAMRAVLHEAPDLDPAAFGETLTKTADKDVLFKLKNGTPVTAEQLRILWRDMGGKNAFASADNLNDLATVKGRIPTIVREKVASPIEDVTRIGHTIALMKRSNAKTIQAAMEEVIPRVNRAHVDYGNLTDFERGTMRRLIPFYTWQRMMVPVLLESMIRNPQRVMVYPKAQVSISESQGFERDDTNFFPSSHQIAPSWMTDTAGVPYAQNKRGNVIYGDPSNPINDAIFKGLLLHPGSSIGGSLSPFVRMPIEMFIKNDPVLAPNGRQFFGNIPIKNRAEYVEDNIPLLNQFIRLSRMDPIHGFNQRESTEDRPDEQGTNITALINFLTAGGLQENTARRQEFAEKVEK